MHFGPIENIDLCKILSSKNVVILVPRIVVTELDGHKDKHRSQHVKNRARSFLKNIDKIDDFGTPYPVRNNVGILCFFDPVSESVWDEYDISSNDDLILASLLTFEKQNPEADVIFLSDDTGARTKARMLGISIFAPGDSLKRKTEADPRDTKIKKLNREINEFRSACPEIQLTFKNGQHRFEISRSRTILNMPEEIKNDLLLVGDEPDNRILKCVIYETDIERYQTRLKKYYNKLQTYLDDCDTLFEVELNIQNIGASPGEEIDLIIVFPFSETELEISKNETVLQPRKPKKPEPPGQIPSPSAVYGIDKWIVPQWIVPQSRFESLKNDIGSTDIYELNGMMNYRFKRKKLNHSYSHSLSLFLKFKDSTMIKSFPADFSIRLANAKPSTGKLNFKIEYH